MQQNGSSSRPSNLDFYHKAVQVDDISLLKNVLPNVLVDAVFKDGWTALLHACSHASPEKVEMLLNAGADPCFVSSPQMETAFTCAASANKNDDDCAQCIQLLIKKVPEGKLPTIINSGNRVHMNALMTAANKKKNNTLRTLLRAGARVDDVDSRGRSALYYAVAQRHISGCRTLVEAGADPLLRAKDNSTPLDRAQALNVPALINILEKNDKKPDHPSTPVVVARVDSGLNGSRSSADGKTAASSLNRQTTNGSSNHTPAPPNNASSAPRTVERAESFPQSKTLEKGTNPTPTQQNQSSVNNGSTNNAGSNAKANNVEQTTTASLDRPRPVSINELLRKKPLTNSNIGTTPASGAINGTNGGSVVESPDNSMYFSTPLQTPASVVAKVLPQTSVASDSENGGSKIVLEKLTQVETPKETGTKPILPTPGITNTPVEPSGNNNNNNNSSNNVDWEQPKASSTAHRNGPTLDRTDNVAGKDEDKKLIPSHEDSQSADNKDLQPISKETGDVDEAACGLAASSVKALEDWQLLLQSLNLSHLTDIFLRNGITFQQLLCLTDEDLKNLGIESMGARKKILEAAHLFHVTPWDKDSLPSVYERHLTCKDCVFVFSNVAKQLGCIASSTIYARRSICRLPQLLLNTQEGSEENIQALLSFIDEASYCCHQLTEELALLKENVLQIAEKTEILPDYVASPVRNRSPFGDWRSTSWNSPVKTFLVGAAFGAALVAGAMIYRDPAAASLQSLKLAKKLPLIGKFFTK